MIKRFLLFLMALFTAGLLSCTGNPPELKGIHQEILLFSHQNNTETVGFFLTLTVSDPDGGEDIFSVTLRHPGDNLSWEVFPDSAPTKDDILHLPLITLNPFFDPEGMALPTGSYEIDVYDQAGNRVSDSFNIPKVTSDSTLRINQIVRVDDQGIWPIQQPASSRSLDELHLSLLLAASNSRSHRIIPVQNKGIQFIDVPELRSAQEENRLYLVYSTESGLLILTKL